jgi:predicted nucleic acid-binding protein
MSAGPAIAARPPDVIDSTVAIKWYVPEDLQAEARRFLDPAFDRHAVDFLPAEGGSAILKKVRRRELTYDEGRRVLAALEQAPVVLHPAGPLLDPAFAIAAMVGSSLYDALFLALAVQLDGRLVTADRAFYDKVRLEGTYADRVHWVADPL